jgi:enoyl-CoA hydratase/carnithine racemase
MVNATLDPPIAVLALDDPARRNALSLAMFDSLDETLGDLAARAEVNVVILRGEGKAFCAGFDLNAVVNHPALMATFIRRLSAVNRALRRLPQVVVIAAHGVAIAGGCAILSAGDLVVVSRETKLGYPVHRIGVSPAVTIPTLQQAIAPGAARALLMSGAIINGESAHRLGLASHLVDRDADVLDRALEISRTIASHGPNALRITKHWMNELDGSLDDTIFEGPVDGSSPLATRDEAIAMLTSNWARRQ